MSTIDRSTISGNRISGLFTYGAGVYSDGGSIGNRKTLRADQQHDRPQSRRARAGPAAVPARRWATGAAAASTCRTVTSRSRAARSWRTRSTASPRTDSLGRRNLAGGVAATVGNAHADEDLIVGHSIIAGNTVQEIGGSRYAQDVFTGSLFYFRSAGYNRIGVLDFSQILVPVGEPGWASLSRKHYPQQGDVDGVALPRRRRPDRRHHALDLDRFGRHRHRGISPCCITRRGAARSSRFRLRRTTSTRRWPSTRSPAGATDNFLDDRAATGWRTVTPCPASPPPSRPTSRRSCSPWTRIAATPGAQPYTSPAGVPILTLAATRFFGPAETWPQELENYPYIEFWHRLDAALAAAAIPGMGPELLGDVAVAGAVLDRRPRRESGHQHDRQHPAQADRHADDGRPAGARATCEYARRHRRDRDPVN